MKLRELKDVWWVLVAKRRSRKKQGILESKENAEGKVMRERKKGSQKNE